MGCSGAAGKGPMGRVECDHSNRVAVPVDVVDGPTPRLGGCWLHKK